jgi:hypothetical protein
MGKSECEVERFVLVDDNKGVGFEIGAMLFTPPFLKL